MSYDPAAPYPQTWKGNCPICDSGTNFIAQGPWLRDQLVCERCGSIPRERALKLVLDKVAPQWRDMEIHESSPWIRGVSPVLAAECKYYVGTQYDTSVPFGTMSAKWGYRSEDLEAQTFDDGIFDLVITLDVFEHLLHPNKAIKDIARTLRPGGKHIMTVPIIREWLPSRRRAGLVGDAINHFATPEYHGNPVDPEGGALVTIDWGYDIADYLRHHSRMPTTIFNHKDESRGILGEYLDVLVSFKMERKGLDLL